MNALVAWILPLFSVFVVLWTLREYSAKAVAKICIGTEDRPSMKSSILTLHFFYTFLWYFFLQTLFCLEIKNLNRIEQLNRKWARSQEKPITSPFVFFCFVLFCFVEGFIVCWAADCGTLFFCASCLFLKIFRFVSIYLKYFLSATSSSNEEEINKDNIDNGDFFRDILR